MTGVRLVGNPIKTINDRIASQKALIVNKLVDDLKRETPVDTGKARDGWRIDANGNIVNDVDYIDRLNEGTSKQAPKYFIEQTILSHTGVKPSGTIVRKQ